MHPKYGIPTRQYFFSKYFSERERAVTLISSRSAALNLFPKLGFKNQLNFKDEKLNCVLINGPKIKLGFNLKRIWSWFIFEFRFLLWALFFQKEKPDVIIVSSLSLLTFLTGSFLKKYYNCKLICEVRDIWPLTIIEAKNWGKKNLLIRFLSLVEYTGYKNADAIIGTMPNLKEHVININNKFKEKIFHIPMGYDPKFYDKRNIGQNDPFIEVFDQNIPDGNFIVGYAGTIGVINCTEQIIEAAAKLRNEPISFLLLGNGPIKKTLIIKVKKHGLKNVLFLEPVKKEKVQFFLQKCDLLLHPVGVAKIYKYGLSPNKWIDYMYSSRPILVSYDGYKSIINEANCGRFIRANDPNLLAQTILEFSKKPKRELVEIGQNGKKYLEDNLSYNLLSNRYLNIIDNLNKIL